ncbi:MAG: hypothetical protein RBT37_08810 [Dissulfurispiraceae bacterium]|jgi:hypothetical protein|nr:hypothetical protein [Dissulfurispiraceae bacterium]
MENAKKKNWQKIFVVILILVLITIIFVVNKIQESPIDAGLKISLTISSITLEKIKGYELPVIVDIWKYIEAAQGFPVKTIPTQIIFNANSTPYVPAEDLGIQMTLYSVGHDALSVVAGTSTRFINYRLLHYMGI